MSSCSVHRDRPELRQQTREVIWGTLREEFRVELVQDTTSRCNPRLVMTIGQKDPTLVAREVGSTPSLIHPSRSETRSGAPNKNGPPSSADCRGRFGGTSLFRSSNGHKEPCKPEQYARASQQIICSSQNHFGHFVIVKRARSSPIYRHANPMEMTMV
jgi:hypothetical protein